VGGPTKLKFFIHPLFLKKSQFLKFFFRILQVFVSVKNRTLSTLSIFFLSIARKSLIVR